MEQWQTEALQKRSDGVPWAEITRQLRPVYFPELEELRAHNKIRDFVRVAIGTKGHAKAGIETEPKPEVVGVIGDTHFPFAHPNYINFLQDTFEHYGVTKIIHIGDICDNHAISRWQSEPDSYGANQEFELAKRDVQIYTKAFPKVTLLLGNHCRIPERQAASLGIPKQFLKGTKELWGMPKGWDVDEQVILNGVMYDHGINAMGTSGALLKATNAMMSCVIGHAHSFGGVQYRSNANNLIFGLNVGCGIDIDAYAFRYGKYNKNRETLGCGIVFDSSNAIFVPMSDKYFRNK